MRIVYMGNPEFAVETLKALYNAGHDIAAVVTMPDKRAGRGQQLRPSAVKQFATEKGLKILQPENLKDEKFLSELKSLNADLQVVVAFRMLPEAVWAMPRLGTINVHASLLPDYRGAAPINWAIINGDTKTGISTFLLKHEIDTGDIIMQESIDIEPDDDAGSIHDKLMALGAKLAVQTVESIAEGTAKYKRQENITAPHNLRPAPKIFKDDMKIDWSKSAEAIHNFVRGLSPYPTAWTQLSDTTGNTISVKIFKTAINANKTLAPGQIDSDGKSYIDIGTGTHALRILDLQISGKKRMDVNSFLNGFDIKGHEIDKEPNRHQID